MDPYLFKISTGEWVHLEHVCVWWNVVIQLKIQLHSYTVQQWQQSETKSGGWIPFFSLPPHSPPPPSQIRNKRWPLFFKTPTTFWSVWMELTDNWLLYPPPPPPRNSFWAPWMQSLMVLTTKTTDTHICTPHRVPFHRGGGGGGRVCR